jgi:hypothetical protein
MFSLFPGFVLLFFCSSVLLCLLARASTVKTFLSDHAKQYNNLDIEYVRGKNPELIMERSDGKKDHVNVDKWKTEDILEFLDSRLQNDS